MTRTCAVLRCNHNTQNGRCLKNLFFPFPKNDDRIFEWVKISGNTRLIDKSFSYIKKYQYMCACHFEEDFDIDKNGNKKLKPKAIPTLNLRVKPLPDTLMDKLRDTNKHIEILQNTNNLQNLKNVVKHKSVDQLNEETLLPSKSSNETTQIYDECIAQVTIPPLSTTFESFGADNNKIHEQMTTNINYQELVDKAVINENTNVDDQDVFSHPRRNSCSDIHDIESSIPSSSKKINNKRHSCSDMNNLASTKPSSSRQLKNTSNTCPRKIHLNKSSEFRAIRRSKSLILEDYNLPYSSYNSNEKEEALFKAFIKCDSTIQQLKLDLMERDKEIDNLKQQLKSRNFDDTIKSPLLHQLITAHCRNVNIHSNHRTWTFDDKLLSLNIQKRGIQAYEFLQQLESTCFPSRRTCQRIFSKLSMGVGINEDYFEAIGKKIQGMDPRAKFCILGLDEVAIKPIPAYDIAVDKIFGFQDYGNDLPYLNNTEIANKGLVFMAQGIYVPWVQPLSFYFNKGGVKSQDLASLIELHISKLKQIGIIVKGLVTDAAKPNCSAMDLLRGISKKSNDDYTRNFFIQDGVKIYLLPDAPHEWKCLRNNWLGNFENWIKINSCVNKNTDELKLAYPGNIMVINGIEGLWSDLVLLYQLKRIEGCTTWNDEIMYPGTRDKMRVKNAVKLMSQTTANDLRSTQFVNKKKQQDINVPEQVRKNQNTAWVIELLNNICDVTNGPSKSDKKNTHKRCLVTKESYHWEKWIEYTQILKNSHYIKWDGSHATPPCIYNTCLTMSSMKDLCYELIFKENCESINLRRLHQDIIENLFSCIRRSLGCNSHPTAIDMMRIIKCIIIANFSTISSKDSNCQQNNDTQYLLNQSDWFNLNKELKLKTSRKLIEASQDNLYEYNEGGNDHDDDNNNNNDNKNNKNNLNEDIPVLHLPDYDSDCEAIVEMVYATNEMMPRIITRELMSTLKLHNCNECLSCLINIDNTESGNSWEPTQHTVKLITDVFVIFNNVIAPDLTIKNIANESVITFEKNIKNLNWLNCIHHPLKIRKIIFPLLARIFINREIALSVRKYKNFQTKINNTIKISQQTSEHDKENTHRKRKNNIIIDKTIDKQFKVDFL